MKITNVTKLPEYLREIRENVSELYRLVQDLNHRTLETDKTLREKIHELRQVNEEFNQQLVEIQTRNSEIEHMLAVERHANNTRPTKSPTTSGELFADDHSLDTFYLEFENHFRGTEQEIEEKQLPYIKILDDAKVSKTLPVVDLGCGRGEFLELLSQKGFRPLGVDMNETMVKHAQEKGYEAANNDAVSYLMKQPSKSLGAITGFHIAEHIPFDQLLLLIAEAYRCLVNGGVLILETPNPESLFVGAFTFHYDPSHLKPLPPAIVQFSARFKGFERADIVRMKPELTPSQIKKATSNETLQNALQRLYGPRDYALVAYKTPAKTSK